MGLPHIICISIVTPHSKLCSIYNTFITARAHIQCVHSQLFMRLHIRYGQGSHTMCTQSSIHASTHSLRPGLTHNVYTVNYSCVYTASMSPAFNKSTTHFKHDNMIKYTTKVTRGPDHSQLGLNMCTATR